MKIFHNNRTPQTRTYAEGDIIDWFHEEAKARQHTQYVHSGRGLKLALSTLFDSTAVWVVLVVTGFGIGVVGGWLDILVAWFSDIRIGRCDHNILYNQATCCKGYDAGELCRDWLSWADYFDIRWIGVQSLVQSFVYVGLAVAFASTAAFLVQFYAPYAFHTGIPEIKAILGGYVLDEFLGPWTLLIKSTGLALSVASGLSLGKEGPLVHVACCMAHVTLIMFKKFRSNQAEKRRLLAAAASAGVAVAFGSPLGGVLFALEELDVFHEEVMWRSFVTSAIAAVSLQYIDPFGTSKLVLFQVSASNDSWRAFELVPWLVLGVAGGVLGSLIIKFNVAAALYRQKTDLKKWPMTEVVIISAITAGISYLVVFMRVPTSELVANLFQECVPNTDYHGLCNTSAQLENVFLLLITASLKIVLTAWTFGMMIPAGIFLPTIAIGACLGRAIGLTVQLAHRVYPSAFVFSACPPDPTVRCISPGFYAVIGAAAMLGGVTRMTISLVVILFELTGALSHVLPIMIAVMTAKWVADSFGKEGIYAMWIALRQYPWISPTEYRDGGETCESYMVPVHKLTTIDDDYCTISSLRILVHQKPYNGYPVVRKGLLLGYVARQRLRELLGSCALTTEEGQEARVVFRRCVEEDSNCIDFSVCLEVPTLLLRKEVPLELAVTIVQRMNLRYLLFVMEGKLTGLIEKADIVFVLFSGIKESGMLVQQSQSLRGKPS